MAHHHDDHDNKATVVTATDTPALLKRVSWGAIFAGTIIALGVLILLGILGLAIGFGAVEPGQDGALSGMGIGTAIWWIVTSVIALAVGGYASGRLSGLPDKAASTAHGASVWGLVTVLTMWFATGTAGSLINTATGALGQTAQTVAQAVNVENIETEVVREEARDAADELPPVDTERVRERAAEVADSSLDALSTAAWYAFFTSLLSLGAAVLAAGAGSPSRALLTTKEKVDLG